MIPCVTFRHNYLFNQKSDTFILISNRLPIEAIKAGLYSKESDVYAFGMVTWEVMTAFGQEGVVYDKDEGRELTCVPFNYQQSENV